MNPELLEQRKAYLRYNQDRNDLMRNLCEPLKMYFNAEWFARVTFVLNDQEECTGHYGLITDMGFIKSYLFQFDDNGKSFTRAIRETPFNCYSYFTWSNSNDCPLILMKYQEHGITKGLSIYKRFKDRVEVWSFAGRDPKGIPSIITQASIAPFQDFIDYYDKQKTLNQLTSPFVNYSQPFDMSYIKPHGQIENFKAAILSNKFTLNIGDRSVSLSKREWECLSGMAQGKTYKGVAKLLSLSPRTVETYLNQIREKAGISSKHKLVDYFIEQNESFLG